MAPLQSYMISCTPRSGSHLLAGGLGSTGIAGYPDERFPRLVNGAALTPAQRDALITQPPPEESYDSREDAEYVKSVIAHGTSPNGVFGITMHRFQVNDAVRRIEAYLGSGGHAPHEAFSLAFPNLSYIWLRRRDKAAQAVSWFKAIHTGRYVKAAGDAGEAAAAELEFDYSKVRSYFMILRSFENAWEHFFKESAIEPYTLYYEDLAARYEGSIRQVLAFLRLPNAGALQAPRHHKAADGQSLEWVARFKAMQAAPQRRT